WAWKKESWSAYAFHFLLGHHGLFSLSPIFLLALVGIGITLTRARREPDILGQRRIDTAAVVAALTLALTVIVLGFYLFITPVRTHNYGGWTSGPRQLMWLTPLFLIAMLPCVDWLAARRGG